MKTKTKYFGSTVLLLAALSLSTVACTTTGGMGGDETLYKRMPATEHQQKYPNGHGDGKACHYDREHDSYFCSFSR